MRSLRKFILAAALFVSSTGGLDNSLEAQCYTTDAGGWGYEDSICSPSLMPYIALGTVVVVAIVALAVRHHGHHHHGHSH